jgi:hypothetical protein
MNKSDNSNNINNQLKQTATLEHQKPNSGETHLPIQLAQLQVEHQDNPNQNQTMPAAMILAALPLVTQQGQGATANPPAEAQGQEAAAGADQAQQGAEQAQPQNVPEGKVLGEETLLSPQDIQSADGSAFNPSEDEGDARIVQNASGNVDDVNDTRYDWDRGAPQEEFEFSYDEDETPGIIQTIEEEPPCVLPPIPGGQIITQTNGYYCSVQDLIVYEAGLCDGTKNGPTTTYLEGNLFDTIDTGIYCIDGIDITNLGLLFGSATLNTSDADNWILTGDHFIFTLDTQGFDKGEYSYELTGNVYNTPDGFGGNDDWIDLFFITLQPTKSPCDCNYEEEGYDNFYSETNFIDREFDPALCDCLLPGPTDIQLQVRVVDDAQIANPDENYSYTCDEGSSENGNITDNVLDNDIPSADRIPASDTNSHKFMKVISIEIDGTSYLLKPDNDITNSFTTYNGGTIVIQQNGDYTYTPPDGGLYENDVIFYTSVDSDGSESTTTLTIIPSDCGGYAGLQEVFALSAFSFFDEGTAPIAQDDENSVSEANLLAGSNPDATLLSVTGNILGNDSFDSESPIEIVNIAGNPITEADISLGFMVVSTDHGELKVFLVDGSGHTQGDYVYTFMNASSENTDLISYSILNNNEFSTASLFIHIADDVPSAEPLNISVSEQPLISDQTDGMVVSFGNVLEGAKSGADVMPVSYTPKVAVEMISFEVLNLSLSNQTAYIALGAVITALAGNISKVALAIPLNGDITFGLPDGAEMTIGSDGNYTLAQPMDGISDNKTYGFSYTISDNDGSNAEADLNISVKNFNTPTANEDNIWSVDSGTTKINVLNNDVLDGTVTIKEISYYDEYNILQTISVPESGESEFTTHSGATVKIDRNGNLEYTAGAKANGESDIDSLTYKIVENNDSTRFSIGEIKAHVFDANADFHSLQGDEGANSLDATDLSGTVSMTGAGGTNEFKIDLGASSAANPNPSDIAIIDLFKIDATNTLTFTGVSDTDGVVGLTINDIISSISSVSQAAPNADIEVSFNNGTDLSIENPGFTMSMQTTNELMNQLQEHSILVSVQG